MTEKCPDGPLVLIIDRIRMQPIAEDKPDKTGLPRSMRFNKRKSKFHVQKQSSGGAVEMEWTKQ